MTGDTWRLVNKWDSISPSVWSSLLMAVGGMGDALLYAYLPVKGEALGFSLISIGLLLSINKFARFFTNRWVAWISNKWGIRQVLLSGALLSAGTTLIYGLNAGFWIWVIARLFWGAAYSALRFSTTQYANQSSTPGCALGVGRSIQEAGPLLAYWIGPILLSGMGSAFTFTTLALILLTLLPTFYLLPSPKLALQEIKPLSFQPPKWIDVWIFITSFVVEGLLLVGISKLLRVDNSDTTDLVVMTALYISIRRLLNILLSPLSGWLSDWFDFQKVFQASCKLLFAGLLLLAFGQNELGILVAFIGSAMNVTLLPLLALKGHNPQKYYDTLTRMSTSRDLGSAFGALTGLGLLNVLDSRIAFALLAIVILSLWFKIRKIAVPT